MDYLLHRPTLPGILIRLVVHQICHAAAIVKPLLMIEGLQRLAGAVRLLGGHAALVCIE